MGKTKTEPWIKTFKRINNRIQYSLRYKNIKSFITIKQLKYLWFRDKGWLLKEPSIDRKNLRGNYTVRNCQYIEKRINSGKDKIGLKYDKNRIEKIFSWRKNKKSKKYKNHIKKLRKICKGNKRALGYKHTKESLKKMSRIKLGKPASKLQIKNSHRWTKNKRLMKQAVNRRLKTMGLKRKNANNYRPRN